MERARAAITVRTEARVTIELYRIDDRLIHGQVVVGLGPAARRCAFIVLVDDEVAASEWEQELYRMGVPPEIEVRFAVGRPTRGAAARTYRTTRGPASCSPATSRRCARSSSEGAMRAVNLGGIHHRAGRARGCATSTSRRTRSRRCATLAARGVVVTAQDVPPRAPCRSRSVLAGTAEDALTGAAPALACSAASSGSTS